MTSSVGDDGEQGDMEAQIGNFTKRTIQNTIERIRTRTHEHTVQPGYKVSGIDQRTLTL